jgi:DNA polymerase I
MSAGPAKSDWIYLVDAHSLIFQVFHAMRQAMSSPSGLPTGALFGFCRDLLLLRQKKPRCLICAFDRSEPTFRSEVYPDYKAHREAMPSDLQLQIPLIYQVLEAMAIPVVSHPRYEADDILATLARAGAAQGFDVLICTSDKDCRQLLSDKVRMYNLRKSQEFGRAELQADWGITPEQVVDLQTLVGDPVDNVPGVAGIGIKTAAKLLQEFGSLEGILKNIDKVPGVKKQESLRAAQPLLPMTRKLVELVIDVPVSADWEAWRLRPMDVPRLLALFQEWGFHSLGRQVREMREGPDPAQPSLFAEADELFPFGANAPEPGSAIAPSLPNGQVEVANTGMVPAPQATTANLTTVGQPGWQADYRLVDTPELFEAFFMELQKQARFAVDLETTSLEPLRAEIVGLAFAWQEGQAWYLPLRGLSGSKVLDSAATLARLRPILENPAVAKVNQNIKYDLLVLRGKGIHVQGIAGDCMVADYLLHAGERSHNLEELARRYLNHQVIPITDLIGKKGRKQPQLCMDEVSPQRVAIYAGEDADVAWRLCRMLEPQLQSVRTGPHTLRNLYDDLEIPLIEVLVELEYNGIRIDIPKLRELSAEMARQLEEIEKEIYALAGHPFAINSLVQLRKVLFDELKLPPQRKTGITGAASTDQETLEKLAVLDHPAALLPRKILEHRQIAKLKGTYVDALPDLVNPRTGRVHTSFNQTVASTGRLSASDPNLQNIPVRREQGQQIRQAFLPEAGWLLVTADYSQIELRLLAHFCGDEAMRRAFAEDRDIHTTVAAQIFHCGEKDVTPGQRRVAKTVNFGVIYGMSAHGLSQRLSIPRAEAETFITEYFARYPRVLQYQTRLLEHCRKTGVVTTILGRRRQFDRTAIRPGSTYQQRNQAEREAINMEVQGSAADLIKLAMLHLLRRLRREGLRARMLLQIHDELVFEAPPDEISRLVPLIREEMTTPLETALKLGVPLKVDVSAGPNWLDGTEV